MQTPKSWARRRSRRLNTRQEERDNEDAVFFLVTGGVIELFQDGKAFGVIEERVFSIAPTFELSDRTGRKVARAEQRLLAWGAVVDVYDCENQKLATVKEKIWQSFFKIRTQYEILDPQGKLLGISEKEEFASTQFTFRNANGDVVMTLRRPMFNWFKDEWIVKSYPSKSLDARVLIFVPAFKTAADNRRKGAE